MIMQMIYFHRLLRILKYVSRTKLKQFYLDYVPTITNVSPCHRKSPFRKIESFLLIRETAFNAAN